MNAINRLLGVSDHSFYRALIRISLPVIIQQGLNSMLFLIDNIMIGQLGETSIAAVGLANQWVFLANMFCFGICSAASIFVAQYWGKKDIENIHRIEGITLVLSFFIALCFTISAFIKPQFVLDIYSDDPFVIALGSEYLRIVCFCYIFQAIAFAYTSILRSCGEATLPMFGTLLAVIINGVCNYILIFGKLGFPAMGVRGAAIATVIANVFNVCFTVGGTYLRKLPAAARLGELIFSPKLLKAYFKIGLPVICNEMLWSVGLSTQTMFYGMLGTKAVAAMQVYNTMDRIAFVIFIGIGTSAGVLIGNKIGEGKPDVAREYGKRFRAIAIIAGLIIGAIIFAGTDAFLTIYRISDDVLLMARQVLHAYALCIPFYVLNHMMFIGILRPGGDTIFCTKIEIFGLWLISIPLLFIAVRLLGLPLWLCYLCILPGDIFKIILAWKRVRKGLWAQDVTSLA